MTLRRDKIEVNVSLNNNERWDLLTEKGFVFKKFSRRQRLQQEEDEP